MKLSILIRSIESRRDKLITLLSHLYSQINDLRAWLDVEVLYELDNKQISSGAKANKLLSSATGKYIVFIDDDDWVADYYVKEMLKACESDCDCFGMTGFYSIDGGGNIKWILSKDNIDTDVYENGSPLLLRKTNHITGVKRSIAIVNGFPDKSNAEDKGYTQGLVLNTEYKIELPMYWYRYSSHNKEYA